MSRYVSKLGIRIAVVAVMLVSSLTVAVQPAAAKVDCERGFGAKVPVLMVHGFDGNPRGWNEGPNNMFRMLGGVKDIKLVAAFDYESANHEWVTDDRIGPALASRIDCLAQVSKKTGGSGKVIVVGHSMGGLAAREAASRIIDGRKVADEIGMVITLGTPHQGSPYGTIGSWGLNSICTVRLPIVWNRDCMESAAVRGLAYDSVGLKNLPAMPGNVLVKAIAGNVTTRNVLLFGLVTQETKSDLVVPVTSATAEYTESSRGDGWRVIACEGVVLVGNITNAPCRHGVLPNDGEVQAEVKRSIEQYLASIRAGATDFYGLRLKLGSNWKLHSETSFGRMMIDTSRCTQLQGKEWCSGFTVIDQKAVVKGNGGGPAEGLAIGHCSVVWGGGDMEGYATPPQPGPSKLVGGETAQYSEVDACSLPGSLGRIWQVPGRDLMIASFEFDSQRLTEFEGVLSGATWQ